MQIFEEKRKFKTEDSEKQSMISYMYNMLN